MFKNRSGPNGWFSQQQGDNNNGSGKQYRCIYSQYSPTGIYGTWCSACHSLCQLGSGHSRKTYRRLPRPSLLSDRTNLTIRHRQDRGLLGCRTAILPNTTVYKTMLSISVDSPFVSALSQRRIFSVYVSFLSSLSVKAPAWMSGGLQENGRSCKLCESYRRIYQVACPTSVSKAFFDTSKQH